MPLLPPPFPPPHSRYGLEEEEEEEEENAKEKKTLLFSRRDSCLSLYISGPDIIVKCIGASHPRSQD